MQSQQRSQRSSRGGAQPRLGLLDLGPDLLSNILRRTAGHSVQKPTALFELAKTCKTINVELRVGDILTLKTLLRKAAQKRPSDIGGTS